MQNRAFTSNNMKYGFIKAAAIVPQIEVGNYKQNAKNIISAIKETAPHEAELILLPELCLTSSSCGDLFTQPYFIKGCEEAIIEIAASTEPHNSIIVFGAPVAYRNAVYNCAIIAHKGNIEGIIPKNTLKDRQECNESRHFASGSQIPAGSTICIGGNKIPFLPKAIFKTPAYTFGIEIGSEARLPIPPSALLSVSGAEIILNPASATETAGSNKATRSAIEEQSKRLHCGYIYANSGWGESTANASYAGYASISECGKVIAETKRFLTRQHSAISEIDLDKIRKERSADSTFTQQTDIPYIYISQEESLSSTLTRSIDAHPFIPSEEERDARCNEIFNIQSTALARRIQHTHCETAVIGISGGLDSTLALLVVARAFDIIGKPHSSIITVTMPGFGTTDRTYSNALQLMQSLGTTIKEISIKEACIQHFKDIEHEISSHDVTYENSQARERTQILMDVANKYNGIVIGTGDLSELALGWATYNGDHMSMYGVNASVPKTLVQHIVRWAAGNSNDQTVSATLHDIVDTPISPELTPADEQGNIKQKTEDLVGPYELHDFFLYNFASNGYSPQKIYYLASIAFAGTYDSTTIKKWLRTFVWRFVTQQFKRSCMPDGPITGSCNLTTGWKMPSDTSPEMLAELCRKIDEE